MRDVRKWDSSSFYALLGNFINTVEMGYCMRNLTWLAVGRTQDKKA